MLTTEFVGKSTAVGGAGRMRMSGTDGVFGKAPYDTPFLPARHEQVHGSKLASAETVKLT